tara:strand:- start:81 stop:293 length:213 start_codon:yes stop_codon:yes gene_type:complete
VFARMDSYGIRSSLKKIDREVKDIAGRTRKKKQNIMQHAKNNEGRGQMKDAKRTTFSGYHITLPIDFTLL